MSNVRPHKMQDPSPDDYQAHFASFDDASLAVFLNAGHQDLAMLKAATKETGKRHQRREDTLQQQLLHEIQTPHWSVTPSFVLLVVTSLLSLVAMVLSALALPQVQQAVWPSNSTQASAPGSQPAQRASVPESSNSKMPLQDKPSASASASSPLKASVR